MKRMLLCFCLGALLVSCKNNEEKTVTNNTVTKSSVDLPYTASYTSNWTTDVSDADLKTVMMSYKDWEKGNMTGLMAAYADTITLDMSTGDHLIKTRGDLTKVFGSYRDSLSSVRIDMEAWQKMYAPDKKDAYIVTWYKEYDTFKGGRVDSANFHDINQVTNGKISWYSQYRRALK